MLKPVQMASHDPKIHVVPHFDCLDITNVMLPWMMHLASYDADAKTSGIT